MFSATVNSGARDLICNEAYKYLFLSNTKITPYNNDFNYPSDIINDIDDKENDSNEVIISGLSEYLLIFF